MKLVIIGLKRAGKSTVFEALTANFIQEGQKDKDRMGTVKVPDSRLEILSKMYNPKKTIFAQVEYLLPSMISKNREPDETKWNSAKISDAIIHVLRNFNVYGLEKPSPYKDFINLQQEMILADLMVVEKRLEKIEIENKRGRKTNDREKEMLIQCRNILESEKPIRDNLELSKSPLLKGFTFLTSKPSIAVFNNDDEDQSIPELEEYEFNEEAMVVRGKIEREIASMNDDEAEEFLKEFNIPGHGTDRVIEKSYSITGMISFFTVGPDEVRAWTIESGTSALDAAEVIHSDFKKGFIRAEVISYEDLTCAGSFNEAKKLGTVRLEGKNYEVKDGDIITFRFNV